MKYKHVIVSQFGGSENLLLAQDELPEPQANEVRIKVLAAGVSFADVLMRQGVHPESWNLGRTPFTPGWDVVGVVDKLGDKVSTIWQTGQIVAALPILFYISAVAMMMLIVFAFASMVNNTLAYTTLKNSTITANASSFSLDNIQTKRVRVGDIDIAYKIFGQGKPLLLIPGFSATMYVWDPVMLDKLSSNHTMIVFDNRGIGKTTVGTKTWSIEQFANDTAGLIDALGIQKPVDVLGLSWGGYVAQELTLIYPQKVDRLILYGTDCGGKATILSPQIGPDIGRSVESGNASINTFISIFFPKEWLKQKENADYVQRVFSAMMPSFNATTKENILHQAQTTYNWKGACDRLSSISKPTLVIVGTDDIVRPPANSIMLAEKISGAWLVQIKGGGHGVMYQYPAEFTAVLESFLSIT